MPKENGAAIVASAPSFGWRAGRPGAHTSGDSNPINGMKKKKPTPPLVSLRTQSSWWLDV